MAASSITHVKEVGRSRAEGPGSNLAGVAKNNKIIVWGEIKGTYHANGIAMNLVGGVKALGLETMDFIHLDVRAVGAAGTTIPADDKLFLANYARTSDKIFLADLVGEAGAVPSEDDIITMAYLAAGDSQAAPDQV